MPVLDVLAESAQLGASADGMDLTAQSEPQAGPLRVSAVVASVSVVPASTAAAAASRRLSSPAVTIAGSTAGSIGNVTLGESGLRQDGPMGTPVGLVGIGVSTCATELLLRAAVPRLGVSAVIWPSRLSVGCTFASTSACGWCGIDSSASCAGLQVHEAGALTRDA